MDIYYDILSAARQSVRKTHIMYRSNLSYKQLDTYLSTLMECELMEEGFEDGGKVYNVTSKGLDFIELFENLSEYLSPRTANSTSDSKISERRNFQFIEKQSFVY